MPSHWYKSLYWRVAIGFSLCLAAMLVVQAVLFIWFVSRAGPILPGQPPDRFAQTVARDLADALERDPSLDVAAFIKQQFGRDAHPFFVMMADERVFSNDGPFSEDILQMARATLQRTREFELRGFPPFGRGRGFSPPRGEPSAPDRGGAQ